MDPGLRSHKSTLPCSQLGPGSPPTSILQPAWPLLSDGELIRVGPGLLRGEGSSKPRVDAGLAAAPGSSDSRPPKSVPEQRQGGCTHKDGCLEASLGIWSDQPQLSHWSPGLKEALCLGTQEGYCSPVVLIFCQPGVVA